MKDSCLVLEGGGLRGAFTSGVLEYLLEQNIRFDRVVGVSAGACVGASYVSRQKGRNKLVNVEYPSDKRYMGWKYLFTTGSYFNMKFVFGELPIQLVPFDETTFYANPTEFEAVTTGPARLGFHPGRRRSNYYIDLAYVSDAGELVKVAAASLLGGEASEEE